MPRFSIGLRTLKTVAAVLAAMVIVDAYGATASKLIFAMLGAMAAAFLLGLSFTGVSVYAVTVLTVCVLLWGGLGWLVLTKLTPLFGCRSREETLAFIRENLLIE